MAAKVLLLSLSLFLLPFFLISVYAEHVFKEPDAFAQYLDISQIESEKFVLEIDGYSYDVYYGYHGSLDALGSDTVFPILDSMQINMDKKSLEITMDSVPEKTDFWVRMPDELIHADNEKFKVLVDGVDTGYDLMKFPNDHVIGFFITEDAKNIEIIGTRVVPEFGTIAIMSLGIAILMLILMRYTKSSFGNIWTRIN